MTIAHITPLKDLREHLDSINCPCMPTSEDCVDTNGRVTGLIVIHNTWDTADVLLMGAD